MESVFIVAILIFSVVIHEVAHGSAANSLGDPTAKYAGRLTLNPLKHLDFMGSFIVPLFLIVMRTPFIFGWAKPVPINPYNFSDQKYGRLKVALAGPLSNLSLAALFGIALRFFPIGPGVKEEIGRNFPSIAAGMMEAGFWGQVLYLFLFIIFINTLLAIFNLIPIPPLDGSHVLFTFFPALEYKMKSLYAKTGFLGIIALILLVVWFLPFVFYFVFGIFKIIAGI